MKTMGPLVHKNLCLGKTDEGQVADQIQELMAQDLKYRGANTCLLYTSPSPRDLSTSRMPSSA